VRLSSGARLDYDHLVLAVGARATSGIAGALTFRDHRDLPQFRAMLRELSAGLLTRVLFAVPPGCSWPLPLYELALLAAEHVAERGLATDISIVTPERSPLAIFGPQPSRVVASLLERRQVSFRGLAPAREVRGEGGLLLRSGEVMPADRVVAIPELRGRRISGVPAGWRGFVPTDSDGRVDSLPNVYAAGDMASFPIKQAALATQQADRIAELILAAAGASITPLRRPFVLRAQLVGGEEPVMFRAELDRHGRATEAAVAQPTSERALSEGKVFARYLTPYLTQLGARIDRRDAMPIG
jgi:sulfide:quinone oxidoreductase